MSPPSRDIALKVFTHVLNIISLLITIHYSVNPLNAEILILFTGISQLPAYGTSQ